jgi:predicted lysophospholipase L1 biosynthesis ABC-type transport system permease subunit
VGGSLTLNDPRQGGPQTWQVVGVVGDLRGKGLMTEPEPMVYFSFHQKLQRRLALLARAETPIQAPLRTMLRESFPEIAVVDLVPFSDQVRRTLADQRMMRDLGAGFGLAGLGLAALGIFALLSYSVSRRTRELGIRQAVGATPAAVRRLVLSESGRLVAWGIALGTAAAWALGRWLESFLYGLEARDPGTWLAVAATVAAAALVAALLPAVRASRVSPLAALRQE